MTTLDSVPITACHECIATLTLPLALFLLLAETTVGGVVTVAFLRLTGGLTHGFLKFNTVTYAILSALALNDLLSCPPGTNLKPPADNEPTAATPHRHRPPRLPTMRIQDHAHWRPHPSTI